MSKAVPLLDDGSDEEVDFSINKSYAENYDKWRKKEEMMKLKALGEELSESSSSSEEEVEPIIEKDFLKTLSLIKSKDPVIYNENVTFFKDEGIPKKPKVKKEKSMFMKNYEAELVLKTEGRSSDEEEDDQPPKPDSKELAELAKSFKTAVDSDDDEEGEGGLFAVKSRTKQEEEKEEEEHLKWLKGQKKEIDKEMEKELSFLHKYWNDTKLDAGEKFLKDYLLNQRYLDSNAEDIPSYEEIEEELQQEDETIAQQEQFEEKYNFRFEEPDPEFIKRYPRTIGDSLRREDNRRKAKREEREERKKRDKEQMKEELKRLKALKRKEIEEKFFKLKEASGKDEINFDESDIESDFDPDKHDEKMKELFDDDYYAEEEEQKPEFLYDAEIDDEDWDHWTREQAKQGASSKGAGYKEEEEESSASEVEEAVDRKADFEQEMIESTRTGRRKGKKKSLFAQLLAQPKPVYDPDGKSFQEYLDEYYNLDYEDVIGDLPVKFKYRKVIPNNFGLTTDEILAANDKELNRWCSVKKTCQYRRDDEEIYEVQAFKKKAENTAVKKKILASVYAPPEEDSAAGNESNNAVNSDKPKKKRRKKKKKSLNGTDSELNLQNESMETATDQTVAETAKDVQSSEVENKNDTENEPKKKRSRKRKKKSLNGLGNEQINLQNESMNAVDHVEPESTSETQCSQLKKKKKRKSNPSDESNLDLLPLLGDGSALEEAFGQELSDGSFKKKKHKKSHSLEENNMDSTVSPDESAIQTLNSTKKDKHLLSLADTNVDNSFGPSESVATGENSPMKKKRKHSDSNHFPQEEQVSGEPRENNQGQSKKKKRKKNADACGISHESSIQIADRDSSFHSQNNFTANREKSSFHSNKSKKNKQKPFKPQSSAAQSDKRLTLSDSRLEAFGINPKKFKNKIIYSQK